MDCCTKENAKLSLEEWTSNMQFLEIQCDIFSALKLKEKIQQKEMKLGNTSISHF